MTNRQFDNRIKKLRDLEAQKKELENQVEEIRAELKDELRKMGKDEHDTGNFIIRWKEVVSNRLDSAALKKALPDVFKLYSCVSTSRRFTIA